MLIVMKRESTPADRNGVLGAAEDLGYRARLHEVQDCSVILLSGYRTRPAAALFQSLSGVRTVLPVNRPMGRILAGGGGESRPVQIGSRSVGGGTLTLIAGPCAVESEEQLLPLARELKDAGADLLRGGAYKPRSSPYDFQGLGEDGLRLLALAREETGLPVVTEAVDEASLELVERYADAVQIGARNMQNYALIKRAGRCRLPVLLKRGMSAGLEEWLLAAEYILDGGNPNVILCERGIRTFSTHSRFTLDLSVVPQVRRACDLPVLVDPSHASGVRESVAPLSRAAVAVGADGVMIEVHSDPTHALCDGPQSLRPEEFRLLAGELRALLPQPSCRTEAVS